jgi:hypothetical protein
MKFDELVIAVLLMVIGAIRVVPQIVNGGTWGPEPTLAAIILGFGVLVLAGACLRRPEGTS